METTGLRSIEWLAGLFEGEGSLYRSNSTGHWTLSIKMSDLDIVQAAASMWDSKLLGPYNNNNSKSAQKLKKASKTTKPWKDCYEVRVYKRDKIFKIVCDLYPYMGERRREKMNEFINWYVQQEKEN